MPIDKEKWKDLKRLTEEQTRGAKVAEQWVKLSLLIGQLNQVERAEFDRILDNLNSHIGEEIAGGPIGENPNDPPDLSDDGHHHN